MTKKKKKITETFVVPILVTAEDNLMEKLSERAEQTGEEYWRLVNRCFIKGAKLELENDKGLYSRGDYIVDHD